MKDAAKKVEETLRGFGWDIQPGYGEFLGQYFNFQLPTNEFFVDRYISVEDEGEVVLVLHQQEMDYRSGIYLEIDISELQAAIQDSNEGKVYDYRFYKDKDDTGDSN